jgi:hypothetical protein
LGGGEDEVQHAALLGRELRLDQVGRLLRIRPWYLELVFEAPADCAHENDQEGHDADPRADDTPWVPGAGTGPAR